MTDWVARMKETVQPHVAEPLLAVGMLQPAGTWGAFGAGQLSGVAAMVMRKAANKKAGGLGKQGAFKTREAILGITQDKIYAFNGKPSGRSWKVLDKVGEWDRSDLAITTTKGSLSTKVVIDVKSSGDHFELEATTIMQVGNLTDVFLAELTRPTGTTGQEGESSP
jgi:hypothetical protein